MRKTGWLACCGLLFLLAVLMSACGAGDGASAQVRLEYELNSERTGYDVIGSNITGRAENAYGDTVDVVIPPIHEGLPVTGIYAIHWHALLAHAIIPVV